MHQKVSFSDTPLQHIPLNTGEQLSIEKCSTPWIFLCVLLKEFVCLLNFHELVAEAVIIHLRSYFRNPIEGGERGWTERKSQLLGFALRHVEPATTYFFLQILTVPRLPRDWAYNDMCRHKSLSEWSIFEDLFSRWCLALFFRQLECSTFIKFNACSFNEL